jgi:hypothetical protein
VEDSCTCVPEKEEKTKREKGKKANGKGEKRKREKGRAHGICAGKKIHGICAWFSFVPSVDSRWVQSRMCNETKFYMYVEGICMRRTNENHQEDVWESSEDLRLPNLVTFENFSVSRVKTWRRHVLGGRRKTILAEGSRNNITKGRTE